MVQVPDRWAVMMALMAQVYDCWVVMLVPTVQLQSLAWDTDTDGTGAGPFGRDDGIETGAPGTGCEL